jgi:hypothetical protein
VNKADDKGAAETLQEDPSAVLSEAEDWTASADPSGVIGVDGLPPEDDGEDALPPDLPPCPVVSLGQRDGTYHLLTPWAEYRAIAARGLNGLGVDSLFGGQTSWLRKAYPRLDKEGVVVGYSAPAAARALMRACTKAGFFDPVRSLRGTSVWLSRDKRGAETLLVHCGDRIFEYGPEGESQQKGLQGALARVVKHEPGLRRHGHVYPALPAESRPGPQAAAAGDAVELLGLLSSWNWRQPSNAPMLVLGWLAAAMIAGALHWRPHIWVTGDAGSGKSSLEILLADLLGSTVLRLADSSEAGVRQALGPSARAVMLDEIEKSASNNRARDVVMLARLASTDRQAPVGRGSLGGVAQVFHVRAVFYLTSILHAPLAPQDAERITVLDLDDLAPLPPEEQGEGALSAPFEDRVNRMAALGPALRERMIRGYGRYRHNLGLYKALFARAGKKARLFDQFGTLLAAAHTLLSDQAVSPAVAEAEIAALKDGEIIPDQRTESGPMQCLNWLMSTAIEEAQPSGDRYTGTISEAVWRNVQDGVYQRALGMLGLKVQKREADAADPDDPGFDLLVANAHRGLLRIFHDSDWSGGAWSQALRRLPGARAGTSSTRIGGIQVRYTIVPGKLVERIEPLELKGHAA